MPGFVADAHVAAMAQRAAEILRRQRLAVLPSGQTAQMPGRSPGGVKPPPNWLQPFAPRAQRPAGTMPPVNTMPFDPRVQRPAGTEAPANWLQPFDPRTPKGMAGQAAVAARETQPSNWLQPFDPRTQRSQEPSDWLMPFDPRTPRAPSAAPPYLPRFGP